MLDYAANAVRYWPVSALREALEQTAGEQERTGEQLLAELRPDLDVEEFWSAVATNLAAGRVRMLFVADALPPELVRIIEFLNEQMSPAEVLGVELRQYVGGEHTVYVPHVVGRSTVAAAAKTGPAGRQWDRDSFLNAAAGRCPQPEVALMRTGRVHRPDHILSSISRTLPGGSAPSGWNAPPEFSRRSRAWR
jgi:hypothetical protein